MQGMAAQVKGETAAMLNHYFLVKRLLNMKISYRDIIELIDEKDIEYLIGIDEATEELKREYIDKANSVNKGQNYY